jgi:conjugative transfer region protein TrbK
MRGPLNKPRAINWGCVLPALGYLAVAGGIVAGAIYLDRHSPRLPHAANLKLGVGLSDELARDLALCQALGSRAQDDVACTAAWRDNRSRFFGGHLEPNKATSP